MANRGRWNRPLRLESFERRDTPTALTVAHPLSGLAVQVAAHPAPHPKGTPFLGAETLTLNAPTALSAGNYSLTGSGSGRVSGTGNFTSRIALTFYANSSSFTGTSTLIDGFGNRINTYIAGSYDHELNNSAGNGAFAITGGTGVFANASGHGTIRISPIVPIGNTSAGHATLRFHGRIAP